MGRAAGQTPAPDRKAGAGTRRQGGDRPAAGEPAAAALSDSAACPGRPMHPGPCRRLSPLAVLPRLLQCLQVGIPALLLLLAQFAQVAPAEDAGVVAVVEAQQHTVVADRFDGGDVDVALAGHQLPLPRAVALDLG